MPEIRFRIRWPDGTPETCYSPSLVVKDFFSPGETYSLVDFLKHSRTAFRIASERVEAKYGWPCERAMSQLARIEDAASAFTDDPAACVAVDAFEE
jgi:uncharacterized repeat protein (TIGR04042 family)